MQRWTVDAASLVSFGLVVVAATALPAPVALTLTACEVAFAASAAIRYRAHSATGKRSSPPAGSATSGNARPRFRWLRFRKPRASVLPPAAAHTAGADGHLYTELTAERLFDEKEGHLPLLSGGHLLAAWFHGLEGPHQLRTHHVAQLLGYLLEPAHHHHGNQGQEATAAAAAAADGDELPLSPRLRSWTSRLMMLVQRPQEHAAAAATAHSTAAAAAPRLLAASSDPLVASYRPLSFYVLTEAVAGATHLALRLMGFRLAGNTPGGTAAVYEWAPRREAVSSDATTEPPLVFLHGIGLGLTPYLRLLRRLVAAGGGRRRVLAVQYKHVSMRLTSAIPAPHEVAADVAAWLAAQGVRSVSLLAHSYGTLVASALTKLAAASPAAPAVDRLTLVDPVCFAMFLPHLVRNAIYQQPLPPASPEEAAAADLAGTKRCGLLRSLLKGLVVAEFHCSVALRRRLDWSRVNLWPSELPPASAVVLSGRDNLVPVAEVRAILAHRAAMTGPGAPQPAVLFRPDLGHGGFLADRDCQARVIAEALGCGLGQVTEAMEREARSETADRAFPPRMPAPTAAAAAAVAAPAAASLSAPLLLAQEPLDTPAAALARKPRISCSPVQQPLARAFAQLLRSPSLPPASCRMPQPGGPGAREAADSLAPPKSAASTALALALALALVVACACGRDASGTLAVYWLHGSGGGCGGGDWYGGGGVPDAAPAEGLALLGAVLGGVEGASGEGSEDGGLLRRRRRQRRRGLIADCGPAVLPCPAGFRLFRSLVAAPARLPLLVRPVRRVPGMAAGPASGRLRLLR